MALHPWRGFNAAKHREGVAMNRFEGKTVCITGAATGIGAACGERLLSEGARIGACDLNAQALEERYGNDERVLVSGFDVTNTSALTG